MTLDELEQCISQLLALARSRGIERLDTGKYDSYWNVPSPEWVDMTKQLRAQPERASSVDLDRAAAMLRLISDELSR